MANLVQKLVKTQSHRRLIASFNHQIAPNLTVLQQPHINSTKIEDDFSFPNSVLDSQSQENLLTRDQQLQIYPSFPFGFCLNPISLSGLNPSQLNKADDCETDDDSKKVWADSVKKKRKKKMNKHKYKKLRKRLRRQT